MKQLWDKLALLCCCLLTAATGDITLWVVTAMLLAVILSACCCCLRPNKARWLCAGYLAFCLFQPAAVAFIPLMIYDSWSWHRGYSALWLLPLAVHLPGLTLLMLGMVLVFSCLACLLQNRTQNADKAESAYRSLQDRSKETALTLEAKNKELLQKQDYEVRLATLHERNRIAQEIHDNVGHMLTRSILQVGALMVVNHDPDVAENLATVKQTLTDAMDAIRSSVHDLHDESVDLEFQLRHIIQGFSFCPVTLDYDAGEMPKELKYCFLAIVREGLSNVYNHSNASKVQITLREHPAFYQLIIQDNGTKRPQAVQSGIGLKNMQERVEGFNGSFAIQAQKGFRLFITIPKEANPS